MQRKIASLAAAIETRDGFTGSSCRAMTSGSTTFAVPSNEMAAVRVLLPDPFGPATRVRVGTLGGVRGDFAHYYAVGLTWVAGIQTYLKPPCVRQFLNIAPLMIHEDDRMTGGQGVEASKATRRRCGLGEVVGKNGELDHQCQYRAVNREPGSRKRSAVSDPVQRRCRGIW